MCDPELKQCATEVTPHDYDLYVSASAGSGGDGSLENPFRTITEALDSLKPGDGGTGDASAVELGAPGDAGADASVDDASAPHASPATADASSGSDAAGDTPMFTKRIFVEPGTYDKTLGERFPLVIPGGVALDGAGADRTFVEGMGTIDPANAGTLSLLSMMLGDPVRTTRVSGFTLRPGKGSAGSGTAVYCLSGSAAMWNAATVPPNTILSNMGIGPYYYEAIYVGSSNGPGSGCNLRVAGSMIADNDNGIQCGGCPQPIALESEGNLFRRLVSSDSRGAGVHSVGCTSRMVLRNNSFLQSDTGVDIYADWSAENRFETFTIQGNTFDSMTVTGLGLAGSGVIVDDFSDNTFTNNTRDSPGTPALHISPNRPGEQSFAIIQRARDNRFVGNDIGVLIESYDYPNGFPGSDFGTRDDPGNNVFRCNGASGAAQGLFGDVIFDITDLSLQASFPFEGNEWDHAPVQPVDLTSVQTSVSGDLLVRTNVAVDTSNARTSPLNCPRGILP
jgi:hypothetical protein